MLLRLWNTKVGVPDQSYYLHLAMQVKIGLLLVGMEPPLGRNQPDVVLLQ
jgi:hypothetical protein